MDLAGQLVLRGVDLGWATDSELSLIEWVGSENLIQNDPKRRRNCLPLITTTSPARGGLNVTIGPVRNSKKNVCGNVVSRSITF